MELKGKVIHKLEKETGESKAGKAWEKQTFVIETNDSQYPKKIAIQAFGKAVEYSDKLKAGDNVTVQIDIESREYNEKWYTNINAWKIVVDSSEAVDAVPIPKAKEGAPSDDLPF